MHTHTVRNKNKPTPIVTLTKKFYEMALEDPFAFHLSWCWFIERFKITTSKTPVLQHEQLMVLDDMFLKMHANREKVEDVNLWHIEQMFTKGFLPTASKSFDEMFTIAVTFRKMFVR